MKANNLASMDLMRAKSNLLLETISF